MLVLKTKKENEESPATEGARRATGVAGEAAGRNGDRPDPEVSDKGTRRRFSAAYKRPDRAGSGPVQPAGRTGGITAPGGSVWLELERLATATRCRGPVGQGFAEARTESPAEGRPETSASLSWNGRGGGSAGSWSKRKRSSRSKKKSHTLLGIPLKSADEGDNH